MRESGCAPWVATIQRSVSGSAANTRYAIALKRRSSHSSWQGGEREELPLVIGGGDTPFTCEAAKVHCGPFYWPQPSAPRGAPLIGAE